ncbi:MAG: ArnT family glycosyltransferase [Acidithiobacillus ferriphilus]
MSEQRRGTFVFQALLLFLFAFWLFAFHTGDASLWDVDEPNNAQALKEMMLHHNLVVPTFSAALRPDKPILNYWLMWAGVRLLGMNSWGLRIGSVAMGALLVFYLALALRRLYGDQTALLAGLLTATALHSQIIFRAAVPDPLLILFVAIALISYLRGYLYPEEERRGVLIACSAMGLATLAKGPIGFLLPGLIIVIFLLLRRDLPSLWRNGHLTWGIPLFLVITLPWYLAVGVETHWVWDWLFVDQQNVDRYAVAMQGHHGPVYYYLFTISLALLPWTIFLPQTFAELWRRRSTLLRQTPADAFMLVWAITWVAFFSLGATKLPNYVWEAYPALFVLIAARLYAALNQTQPLSRRGVLLSLGALFLVGVALLVLGAWLVPERIPPLGDMMATLGLPYIIAALLALLFAWRGLLLPVISSLGAGTIALTACLMLLTVPAMDTLKPSATMGRMIRASEGTQPYAIATWRWFEPSFLFYGGRGTMPVHQLKNLQELYRVLADGQGTAYLALPAQDIPAVRTQLSKTLRVRELYSGYELYSRKYIALLRIRGSLYLEHNKAVLILPVPW